MDYYKVSAPARDKLGNDGVLSIRITERSSESIPREEMALALMMAADRQKVELTGPMTVELEA